ncbi:hypothetical protein [Streptomyces sp. NPDC019507]|uniref:hypothetical protein n=1 Tax=Streptomyces sp. NPDC019507 TaxID=3154689 RepID=UPI0033FE6D33
MDTPLLDSPTAAFRHVIAEPGTAEAFDRDFGGLRTARDRRRPDLLIDHRWLLDRQEELLGKELTAKDFSVLAAAAARHRVNTPRLGYDPDAY